MTSKKDEILEIWGDEHYQYRKDAHFEADLQEIRGEEYVHAKFWRRYDFTPNAESLNEMYDETNSWEPFTSSPYGKDLEYDDSLCFLSVASFYNGEYPYDNDALQGTLPGFYVDDEQFICYIYIYFCKTEWIAVKIGHG